MKQHKNALVQYKYDHRIGRTTLTPGKVPDIDDGLAVEHEEHTGPADWSIRIVFDKSEINNEELGMWFSLASAKFLAAAFQEIVNIAEREVR